MIVNTATFDAGESRLMQIESRVGRGFAALQLIGNASEVCRDGKDVPELLWKQLILIFLCNDSLLVLRLPMSKRMAVSLICRWR